jgi:hypothetical protein
MGRVIEAFFDWLEHWDLRATESRIAEHFSGINPDSVTDIDKYLRSHGLMP